MTRTVQENGVLGALILYAVACLIFGGAGREGYLAHGFLQSIAALGIAVLCSTWPKETPLNGFKFPLFVMFCVCGLGVVQLIVWPVEFWRHLPGRSLIYSGFVDLEIAPSVQPISLDAESTLSSLGYFLTPIFAVLCCARVRTEKLKLVAPWLVALLSAMTVSLGFAQAIEGESSNLYLYDFTSEGLPVGFFSNVNHQACFLVIALPFLIALLKQNLPKADDSDRAVATIMFAVGLALICVVGIIAARSMAGYALLAFCLIANIFLMSFHSVFQKAKWLGVLTVVVIPTLAFALVLGLISANSEVEFFAESGLQRLRIWDTTWAAIQDHWIVGSGLGTYEQVIPLYEDSDAVTSTFVAKAHNEYLQVLMEGGIAGTTILIVCIWWVVLKTTELWSESSSEPLLLIQKAASFALIILSVHSLVDYPVRTPAMSLIVGLCVGLVSLQKPPRFPKQQQHSHLMSKKRLIL